MNSFELKAIQEPLKEAYRSDPSLAKIILRAEGHAEGLVCKVSTGKSIVEAGLHPKTGGDLSAVCSGDMLLEALVACAGVTLRAVATSLSIDLHSAKIVAEGELDFRGTLAVSKEVPIGISNIKLTFELGTVASKDQVDSLIKLTERYCVVLQTLKTPAVITSQIVHV